MPRKKTSSSPASPTSSAGAATAVQTSKVTSIESRPPASAHSNGDAQYLVEEHIRHRAYELYEQRGRHDGLADQDWLRAEAELRAAAGKRSA